LEKSDAICANLTGLGNIKILYPQEHLISDGYAHNAKYIGKLFNVRYMAM